MIFSRVHTGVTEVHTGVTGHHTSSVPIATRNIAVDHVETGVRIDSVEEEFVREGTRQAVASVEGTRTWQAWHGAASSGVSMRVGAWPVEIRQGRRGTVGFGRHGGARNGSVTVGFGLSRRCLAGTVRRGRASHGQAGRCLVRQARFGKAAQVSAGPVMAGKARQGTVSPGEVWLGAAGEARYGQALSSPAMTGTAWQARPGMAR